uniref:Uncharacterized protein n=1 Tax=viral metagenome TaxID=1070528 RepID=A0A6C0CMB8_9ZZZZ
MNRRQLEKLKSYSKPSSGITPTIELSGMPPVEKPQTPVLTSEQRAQRLKNLYNKRIKPPAAPPVDAANPDGAIRVNNPLDRYKKTTRPSAKSSAASAVTAANRGPSYIIFSNSFGYGGADTWMYHAYNYLKTRGRVYIWNIRKSESVGKSHYEKDDIIEDLTIVQLQDFIKTHNITYIIINNVTIVENPHIFKLWKAAGKKIITVSHTDWNYFNSKLQLYSQEIYRAIVTNHHSLQKFRNKLKGLAERDVIKVLKNCVATDKYEKKEYATKTIAYIGRVTDDKNVRVLVHAFRKLIKTHPTEDWCQDLKLYIIGSGSGLSKVAFDVEKMRLESKVVFKGMQEKHSLTKYYSMMDYLVLPSISEGCSFTILESMAHGTPVIASNIPANREIGFRDDLLFNIEGYESPESLFTEDYSEIIQKVSAATTFNQTVDNLVDTLKIHLSKPEDEYLKISHTSYEFVKDNYSVEKFNTALGEIL